MASELARLIAAALVSGELEITAYQQWGSGAMQVTLKPSTPAPAVEDEGRDDGR